MAKKLLSLFGLKFNPFVAGVPTHALYRTPLIDEFTWRLEQQISDGGFALVSGEAGCGKSASLRILAAHLGEMRDVTVGVLTRPHASVVELRECLNHLMKQAGNAKLLTPELISTLADHAAGNYRVLTNMAGELLASAARRELAQLDQGLFIEVFSPDPSSPKKGRRT